MFVANFRSSSGVTLDLTKIIPAAAGAFNATSRHHVKHHKNVHAVRNVFWGVVTNPNGQCTVLGVPAGSKPPIWQLTPQTWVFCT